MGELSLVQTIIFYVCQAMLLAVLAFCGILIGKKLRKNKDMKKALETAQAENNDK